MRKLRCRWSSYISAYISLGAGTYVGMSKVPVISQFNKFINLLDLIQCSQNPMEIIPSTSKDPLAV